MATLAAPQPALRQGLPAERWVLILGLSVLIGPTLVQLAEQFWSQEAGVHGPIVLATGIWLLMRQRQALLDLALAVYKQL